MSTKADDIISEAIGLIDSMDEQRHADHLWFLVCEIRRILASNGDCAA